ncbi:MAG: apolipoprotein N-acyltransferase [Sedimentisphaerales bacterium]|nr:apolipoprotein N-acyltransferase [Sedimentisphaerales bacterium]
MNTNEHKKNKVETQVFTSLHPLKIALPFIASAFMLTVIQTPIELSIFAWISYVPFLLAAHYFVMCDASCVLRNNKQNSLFRDAIHNTQYAIRIRPRRLFFVIYIVAIFYWLVNLYWLTPITIAGWLVLCLYTGLLWPVLYFCLNYSQKKKIPLFIAAAVLIVGVERMQGLFLGGFFWRFLAHSQYKNITIIQIADIFGAGGVSFLIAMVNGIIAELIIAVRSKKYFTSPLLAKTGMVVLLVIAAVLYGKWRIGQEEDCVKKGPLTASLQSNIPQSLKNTFESGAEIFNNLMKDSNEAVLHNPDLIVWPETMVQGILNPEVLHYREDTHKDMNFDIRLREHAKDNTFLLIGAYGATTKVESGEVRTNEQFNSAFLYTKDGYKAPEVYNKIHLVPFGEVLPLKKSMAWFYQILMNLDFIPYDLDYSLDFGKEYTVFNMKDKQGQDYKFSVIICYEDTVPGLTRKFALDEDGKKQIDWLVNISNDGWFVKWSDDKVIPSAELPQHAAVCVFRAVENRLAVLRSVNTGISCLIDTYGRIKNGYSAGTLPENAMERKGMSGWFADKIPIDTRATFFSKYGEWLDFFCEFCVFFVIIISLSGKYVRFKKR